MTEEIKEIIHCIEINIKHNELFNGIDAEECKLLLDYITNLQQKDFESQKEIMKLKDRLEQQRKEYQDTYKDVRIEIKEKNERIANLQQDLDKANDIIEKDRQFYKCRMDEYVDLKKENERLKEENKRIFSKVNDDELLISNAMNYAEAQDYKSKCEKAIEYINHENFKRTILVGVSTKKYTRNILDNVLNILQGSYEE